MKNNGEIHVVSADVGVYNKGQAREDGSKLPRFFLRTKKKHNGKQHTSYDKARWFEGMNGVFSSVGDAEKCRPLFLAYINGVRVIQPKRMANKKEFLSPTQKCMSPCPQSLDMVLKQQRDIKKQTGAELRRKTLYYELRKVSEADASIVDAIAGELHRSMKANANPGYVCQKVSQGYTEAQL